MIIVSDIYEEAQRVLGTCEENVVFARLTEAIELLANLGHWDPLVGMMDICTCERDIVLPMDVEMPLAVNIGGKPADFRNKWFEFHLNGPGSDCCSIGCGWNWADKGEYPTFRDIHCASQIAAYSDADEGDNFNIRVLGYDASDKWIMTANPVTGALEDGFDVPVLWGLGWGMPAPNVVKRITRVIKPVSVGFIYMVGISTSTCCSGAPVKLGYYLPNETEPQYRRITLNGGNTVCQMLNCSRPYSSWVRMRFRRKTFKINSQQDVVFLHSQTALKLALMAIKKYENDLLDDYKNYKAEAKVALNEEQATRSGPNQMRVQFQKSGFMSRRGENMI